MGESKVLVGVKDAVLTIRLEGDVRLPWCPSIEQHFENTLASSDVESVCVDLTRAENVDSTTLGVIAKMGIEVKKHLNTLPVIFSCSETITRLLTSMGIDRVFSIELPSADQQESLRSLPMLNCSEAEAQQTVLDAHRTLIDIKEENRQLFSDLLHALENN
ncbi:STAS domain-containing protein [bacterium]|nr:STAS domain-containing protein [bacterium]